MRTGGVFHQDRIRPGLMLAGGDADADVLRGGVRCEGGRRDTRVGLRDRAAAHDVLDRRGCWNYDSDRHS